MTSAYGRLLSDGPRRNEDDEERGERYVESILNRAGFVQFVADEFPYPITTGKADHDIDSNS